MPGPLCQLDGEQIDRLSSRIVSRFAQERLPAISRVEMFLTENCTLRCDYCFVCAKDLEKRMSWDTAARAVDFLITNSRNTTDLSIVFFGGEPLLEFPLMKQTAEYAEARAEAAGKHIGFSVTINGTIMSEEIALFGRKHGFNYLLSVDGSQAAHDRHRKYPNGKGSWDTVTGTGEGYLYIDDGSCLDDGTQTAGVENIGVRVICDPTDYNAGDYLIVTGISSCFETPSGLARRILTRRPTDIQKIAP